MGVHRFHGKAVRFNGYTDGLVVPTGQFKERGVKLNRPNYSLATATEYSNANRIGRIHIPDETNPLNTIIGAFTLDAYIIPDLGGTILHKPGCYKLEAGSPFGSTSGGNTPIKFTIWTSDKSFTLETSFDLRTINEHHSGSYPDGRLKPHDFSINNQPLVMICAQFTSNDMKLYLNTVLIAEMSFGGDSLLIDSVSSDVFIGGRGGEYRGIIESIRISRGTISPILQPLTLLDETVGLWDFNDEIDFPKYRFFSNSHSGSDSQGRDGSDTHDGLFDTPMVFVGYDFRNIGAGVQQLASFKVREVNPNKSGQQDTYKGVEKLASLFTGVPLAEIKEQPWYSSGLLLFSSDTNFGTSAALDYGYSAGGSILPQSGMNLIINHSGTHPNTGTTKVATGSSRYPFLDPSGPHSAIAAAYSEKILAAGVERDLDPMVNPIERFRVIGLDFVGNWVLGTSVHAISDESHASATIENIPGLSGFKFHHPDDTPVWICLGNGDLVIDDGNKNVHLSAHPGQNTRPKDAYTRAMFSQGQRFKDKSGNDNEAFFVSIMSRSPKTIPSNLLPPATSIPTSSHYNPLGSNPPSANLVFWTSAENKTAAVGGFGHLYATAFSDLSGNKNYFYPDTNAGGWKWTESDPIFAGQASYEAYLGTTVLGKGMANMNTNDGEGTRIAASTTNSYTIIMMVAPIATASTFNHTWFGNQGGAVPSSLHSNPHTNTVTFVNPSGGGVRPTAIPVGAKAYAVVIDGATQKIKEYVSGALFSSQIAGTPITTPVNFNDGPIFSIFGNATAVDTAAKTATTLNYGAPVGFRWSEIMIYDKALNDIELAEVNGYLLDRYGFF